MLSQNTYWEVSLHVPDNALQRGPASKNPLPQHPLLVSTNPVINHMHISQTLPSVLNHFTLLNHLIMREKKKSYRIFVDYWSCPSLDRTDLHTQICFQEMMLLTDPARFQACCYKLENLSSDPSDMFYCLVTWNLQLSGLADTQLEEAQQQLFFGFQDHI